VLSFQDDASNWHVSVTTDRRDEIGCALWEVDLRCGRDVGPHADSDLTAWANRLASSVSGLLEALKVIEVDPIRNEALLRSDPPHYQDEHVAYYELHLRGTSSATLRRYVAALRSPERREQITFTLTNEVIAKLVADVAGVP
jgi:hypothetical protein